MLWIEIYWRARRAGKIAFFRFASEADTRARGALGGAHGLDLDRWTLLRVDENAVRTRGCARRLIPSRPRGGLDHTSVITLLNANGAN